MKGMKPLLVCALLYVVSLTAADSASPCTVPDCEGDDCTVACEHGSCQPDGTCQCSQCWAGASCDTYENQHQPEFDDSTRHLKLTLGSSTLAGEKIATLKASDDDGPCEEGEATDCSCAEIGFSIVKGNDDGLFWLNEETGELFTRQDLLNVPGSKYRLIVAAYNPRDGGEGRLHDLEMDAYAMVKVEVQPIYKVNGYPHVNELKDLDHGEYQGSSGKDFVMPDSYSYDEPLERAKRAIPTSPNTVDNVTFYLEKMGHYETVTVMYVGSKIVFNLAIHIPEPGTDLLVELFTPDNDTTHMCICGVTHTMGPQLTTDIVGEVTPYYEAKTEDSHEYDRVILDFGNVTCSASQSTADDCRIYIQWETIMVDNPLTVNGSTYWLSSGAEYNNDDEVWVGQAQMEAVIKTAETPGWGDFGPPTFVLNGPANVPIGATSVFTVNMTIPYPSSTIAFDAFTPLNGTDIMSVCSVLLVDVGPAYSCLPKEKFNFELFPNTDGEQRGNSRGRLDIGRITNANSREPPAEYDLTTQTLTVEFAMHVYDNESYIGQQFWIGAAIEISSTQIWAGQLFVEIVNRTEPTGLNGQEPIMSMTTDAANDELEVVVDQTIKYYVNMEIPENTEAEYTIEVLGAFNDTARMKVCLVAVIFQGVNVPCFGDAQPEYNSRTDTPNLNDRAVWNTGVIKNTGARDVAKDETANTVRFLVVASVLEHELNVDGATLWLTFGLMFDGRSLWVGQNAVIMALTNTLATTEVVPDFNITYEFGDDQVPVHGLASVIYEITTKAETLHTPMTMELILPFNDSLAVLSVCRVEVLFVGWKVPCLDRMEKNESVVLTSKANTTTYDKAMLDLGGVCNIGEVPGPDYTEEDDKIRIRVVFKVEEHPILVVGEKQWVSGGIMYTPTKMWVGQIAMFPEIGSVSDLPDVTDVFAGVDRKDDPGNLALSADKCGVFLLTVKLPPQTTADYIFRVTGTVDISICHMKLLERGWNLPCYNEVEANYTQDASGIFNVESFMEMGPITNVGADAVYNDTIFDNNTLVFEVIAKMSPKATGTHDLEFTADIGASAGVALATLTLDADGVSNVTNTESPEFDFQLAPIRENDTASDVVARGQVVKFYMDIRPANMTNNRLSVKFLTPVNVTGAMEVCDVNVIYIGANMPCNKRKVLVSEVVERDSSGYMDIGSIDLGTVCHFPIVNETENPDAGLIRVEAIARIQRNTVVNVGDKLWFSSTVKINDDQIYVAQLALDIGEDAVLAATDHDASTANLEVNLTGAIQMSPSQKFNVPILITIPANSTVDVLLDVQLPVNESAVMTVSHIEIVESSAGRNLGCFTNHPKDDFEPTYNSTEMTTQMDRGFYDLFKVTNTGVSYRMEDYQPEDDVFTVNVEVQMADSVVNLHNSEHWLSLGAKIGDALVVVDKTVQVIRDDTEKPLILLTANLTETICNDNDILTINCTLQHSNESTAEGYNVTVAFYFPLFMVYKDIPYNNFTTPVVLAETGRGCLYITFERLYFTDIAHFTVEIEVDTGLGMPSGHSEVNTTAPVEIGTNMIWRANNANPYGEWFVDYVTDLSCTVHGSAAVECDIVDLGMQDGSIQDCQITASSSLEPPVKGRKGAAGWKAHVRRGPFRKYLQVFFGNVTCVSEIEIENKVPGGDKVSEITLQYSYDGVLWSTGDTLLPVYGGGDSAVVDVLTKVEARYIRVLFTKTTALALGNDDGEVNVVVEFRGCVTTADMSPDDVCDMISSNAAPVISPVYSRGFVATPTGALYYCDKNPLHNDALECFSTTDGVSWKGFDDTVNIIGVDMEDSFVYGISWDKRAYMVSEDNGDTWKACPKSMYDKAVAKGNPTWVPSIDVQWMKDAANFDPASTTPTASYIQNSYGACYDGIYKNNGPWAKVVDWTRCCV